MSSLDSFLLAALVSLVVIGYVWTGIDCANYTVSQEEFGEDYWIWWIFSAVFWLPLVGFAIVLAKLNKLD